MTNTHSNEILTAVTDEQKSRFVYVSIKLTFSWIHVMYVTKCVYMDNIVTFRLSSHLYNVCSRSECKVSSAVNLVT